MRRTSALLRNTAATLAGGVCAGLAAMALLPVLEAGDLADLLGRISNVEAFRSTIVSWGAAAPLASMALMVLHSFVPFPAELLAVANGMVFGLVLGTVVTWTGAMLGAILAFALARLVGQELVLRLIGASRRAAVESWTRDTGVGALLLARLVPVISFNLVNYAAGLSGVGWWPFLWTTALGILPVTIASVLVGSHMLDMSWGVWTLLAAALVLVAVLHWRRRRKAA